MLVTGLVTGKVLKAIGNLVHIAFEGDLMQGEVGFIDVDSLSLKAEVIEIAGAEAKLQVFENTNGIRYHSPIRFTKELLEAELGPGLLASIFDGLQNPLERLAEHSSYFLPRGVYLPALDRTKKWLFTPTCKEQQSVSRGDTLGTVMEERFVHKIMVPFNIHSKLTVSWIAPAGEYTIEEVIALCVDEKGTRFECKMLQKWPVKMPLSLGERIRPSKMLDVGLRVIDTQVPIVKGGTFCTPGPFGAGKTVLQHHLSKHASVDIVILCACGERAGEVVEVLHEFPTLVDPSNNGTLIQRTCIICNTSAMPVAARESSIYMGVTIGEYYRQMGLDVLLLADSTSRWAQALREISGRLEEIPGEEAFPAYLPSRIAAFYERAGVLSLADGSVGSLSICGAVSPAGGNFEEPVTQATLAVVGAFCGLSKSRADARRYPAIDPLISWSKYIDLITEFNPELAEWGKKVKYAKWLLKEGDAIGKRMEVIGEEGTSLQDLITYLKAELYDFCYLQQNAFDTVDAYCPLARQHLLFALVNTIFETTFAFETRDQAREFFITLQSKIKNWNSLSMDHPSYQATEQEILEMISTAKK